MRTFKDGTTYNNPAMWMDLQGFLWKGPISPDNNMHFARFEGFGYSKEEGTWEIWVTRSSECPDDCVRIRTKT